MRTLYLDCGMGAAGDMLTAALLELLPDQDAFVEELNALGIPGVRFSPEKCEKCGILGTHMKVTIHGEEECEHPHHHGHLADIRGIVSALPIPTMVKLDILSVYEEIARAESHVHGVPVEHIHFHEVGTMDAIADVTAVCLLLHRLAPDKIIASPVHVGSGQVRCAHGILPVPAPATAYLLRGIPIYGGSIAGELCTPTGAALLKYFAAGFGPQPMMRVEQIGCGMGTKDFSWANCLRAMLGETEEQERDAVLELRCELDDMTGEALGFAVQTLLEAGALDVYTTPVQMKKGRPGVLLTVLCREEERERFVRLIFRHTTTLGVRESLCRRHVLRRAEHTEETPLGSVRIKTASGFGVEREKPEYEDIARVARERGLSLDEVLKEL